MQDASCGAREVNCLRLSVDGFRWWVLWDGDLEKAIKHPQAPQGAKKVVPLFRARNFFFADEERRGGVAAIEQAP